MKKGAAFWDASALVPLCVQEASSRHAHALLNGFLPVVWWGSFTEIHSAICRLYRANELTDTEKRGAVARLVVLKDGWREILPGDHVRDLAVRLLDAHALSAADAMQLAAALVWCGEQPAGRTFLCGDKRLTESAKACGFRVEQISGSSAK